MLRFVIEAMVDAVVVLDAGGQITLSNGGAEDLSGFSRDELAAMSVSDLFHDDSSGLQTRVRMRIAGGTTVRREQSWLITKSRERVPVSVNGSAVLDDHGELQGIVIVARDIRPMQQLLAEKEAEIARRRAAEDELRAAKQSIETQLNDVRSMLVLAERRATLGTIAGGVGHELRAAAQIQFGLIDQLGWVIDDHGDVIAAVKNALEALQLAAEHVAMHGAKLLELARPGPDHLTPVDFNRIVRDVASMLRVAGKLGRVELVLALSEQPVMMTVNRTRVEQILVNLVINAVDAMPEGTGTITIETGPGSAPDRVTCSVRDTGSGIAPAALARVFEPFFTTKQPDSGTGLGLPVVRDIVTSYGGTISIDSDVGKGTTVRFELPTSPA